MKFGNFGIKYLQYRYSSQEQFGGIFNNIPSADYKDTMVNYKRTFLFLPLIIHQNILNTRIRPYVLLGFNFLLSFREVNNIYEEHNGGGIGSRYESSYGFVFNIGAGVEADIYKGLMLRTEFSGENQGLVTLGIGYHFATR